PDAVTVISRTSATVCGCASTFASGRRRLISASRTKLVETMKKTRSNRTTSISDVRLTSGSSLDRLCSFICAVRRGDALMLKRFQKFPRFLLHLHDERVDAAPQVAVAHQRRDRDGQPGGRRDQRLRDAAGEHARIAD